jgi:hypothetical protein
MRQFWKFLAREFVINTKYALVAGIIAALSLSALYFTKQPDYYTKDEIVADNTLSKSQQATYKARISKLRKPGKTEYDKYDNMEPTSIMSGHRGMQSEYRVGAVAGQSLDSINDDVRTNFFTHILHNAYTVFLIAFCFLFIRRYFTMIYHYSRTE